MTQSGDKEIISDIGMSGDNETISDITKSGDRETRERYRSVQRSHKQTNQPDKRVIFSLVRPNSPTSYQLREAGIISDIAKSGDNETISDQGNRIKEF
jgi:hypothetical protein